MDATGAVQVEVDGGSGKEGESSSLTSAASLSDKELPPSKNRAVWIAARDCSVKAVPCYDVGTDAGTDTHAHDLEIAFTLPTGAFATVFLREMLNNDVVM